MAYVAVDKDGSEYIYRYKPKREYDEWAYGGDSFIKLPQGMIKKMIGRTLTWDDEPVELKEEHEKCSCTDEIREIVLNASKEGKVVFNTGESLCEISLKEFVKQPSDGMLYDLNRLESVTLTFMDDPKWINDFACAQVIRYLKKQLEEHEKNDSTDFLQGQKLEVERLLNLAKGHQLMESSLQGRLSEIEQKLKEKR